ncbi:MAG: hypothetical protein IT429_26060 [Gemmataceae bacterium]|nr:hypothetical protein [Gemmataceae bacterium]
MTRERQHEERLFRRGQEAAALIWALAVPDRATQLAIARLLIAASTQATTVIETAKRADGERERWPEDAPEAASGPTLHHWA